MTNKTVAPPSQGEGVKTLIPEAGASPRKAGRIRDPAGYRDHSSYLADPAWKDPGELQLMIMACFLPLLRGL